MRLRPQPGRRLDQHDWGRALARLLCVLFAVVGVVPFGLGILVRTAPVRSWAARQATEILRRELGISATYGVHVQALPLALALTNVVVEATDGGGPALEVNRIVVRPRLFSLLAGRLDAGQIEIEAPHARLVVREGKLANVRYRLPEQTDSAPMGDMPFSAVAVTDAAVDLDWDGARLQARDLDLDVSAERGGAFEIALRAGQQPVQRTRTVRAENGPDVTASDEDTICQVDVRARLTGSGALVRRLWFEAAADLDEARDTRPSCGLGPDDPRRVELGVSHLQIQWNKAGRPHIDGAVHVRAPAALTNRFVDAPALHGFVVADVEGHFGQIGTLPTLRGTVHGKGLELDTYQLAQEIDAEVAIEDDVIRAERATVAFADGTVIANKLTVEPLKPGVPMQVASVDLANVQFSSMMRDLGVTSHAHVIWLYRTGRVTPFEGTLAPLKLDGEFNVGSADFEVFDDAFDSAARKHMIGVRDARVIGHLAVRPDSVTFRGAHVDFGASHIETTVTLGFHNDIALSVGPGSHVDLSDISPIASLKMAGRAVLTADMTGKFSTPVLLADLSVQGFAMQDFPLGDITSKVRFTPLVLDFTEARDKKGKSTFEIPTARLDFNTSGAVLVDASVQSQDVHLRDFLHMWHLDTDPRWESVDGHGTAKASIHYDLGGPGDRCHGGALHVRGAVHLDSADLFNEHYDSADSEFDYAWADPDAAALGLDLDLRSLVLRKGRGAIFGSATVRRGGTLHAEIAASELPLARLDAMGALGKALDGTLSATGTVGGTLSDLTADIDARVSPIRAGASTLPASRVRVLLKPQPRPVTPIGRTHCGQPILPSFDRAEYDRDPVDGVFHASGQLFDGQVLFDDLRVTRQSKNVVSGTVRLAGLRLDPLGDIVGGRGAGQSSGFGGSLSGTLDLRSFMLTAPERANATFTLDKLAVTSPWVRAGLVGSNQTISVRDDRLTVPALRFQLAAGGLDADVMLEGSVRRLSGPRDLDLTASVAPIELSHLASLFPKVERASGSMVASLRLGGNLAEPKYVGEAHVAKGELLVRGLGIPVTNLEVDLELQADEARITRGQAMVGGGPVFLGGRIPIRGFRLGGGAIVVAAKGVSVPISDGINAACDAEVRLEIPERESEEDEPPLPKVSGEILLNSFTYTRPIGISADLDSLTQRGKRKTFEVYDPADDFLGFDVRILSREPLRLRNNLIDAQLVLDSDALVVSGTNQRFGLRGRLRILPAGHVRLRANEFEIRQGYVRFDDPTRISPTLDVTAVTDYRRYSSTGASGARASASGAGRMGGSYRITLHAYGDAENLRLDMTSEPALSQEDIVLLLTIGMTRAELDQLQASNLGGGMALEAFSSLTGADAAVRKALPVVDDFRFGTAYSPKTGGTEPTVTLSKRLTNEVRANVTSGLSENRQIRSNVEVKLTPRVSVQGSYDNVNDVSSSALGNVGADIRYRLEFE